MIVLVHKNATAVFVAQDHARVKMIAVLPKIVKLRKTADRGLGSAFLRLVNWMTVIHL